MIDFVKVGCRIAEYRRAAGLSQDELAERLFVTRQALSKWERGLSVPSVDTLVEISRMFSVSFEEILGLFDSKGLSVDEVDIFRGHDRSYVVKAIAEGRMKVNIPDVLYQMSPAERMYILKHIKDGYLAVQTEQLLPKLTPAEQKYLGGYTYEIQENSNRR